MFWTRGACSLFLIFGVARAAWPASGTEGASFLDIPVGGAPAALGSAYTAQANDVYAPVWNPAGLGFLDGAEFTGMHLNYLGPVHYEHVGFVIPLGKPGANELAAAGVGGSIQYLGTGNLDARDENGVSAGSFSSSFAAYTLAVGQRFTDHLSLGSSVKLITEKISNASAKGYAADFGLLYKPSKKINLGAAVVNLGPTIKFVTEGDSLPMAGRLGATYHWRPQWDFSAEGVYRKTGLVSGSLGAEWRLGEIFAFRGGYNTSHIKELGTASGVSAGLGIFFWGQEFAYAWVPVGDLGQTHYFSLVLRTTVNNRTDKPRLKKSASIDHDSDELKSSDPSKYNNIFDFLNEDEKKSVH